MMAEISIEIIKILSLWCSKIVLRLFKANEKTLYRNLERSTLKLERNKTHLMFNETCYNKNLNQNTDRLLDQIIIRNTS